MRVFSFSDLNHCRLDNFGPSVQTLTSLLMDFVSDHQRELPEHGQELCMDLVDVSEKLRIHANRRLGNRKVVLNDVSGLGQIFSELVDALLLKKIQVSRLILWLSVFLSRIVWPEKPYCVGAHGSVRFLFIKKNCTFTAEQKTLY